MPYIFRSFYRFSREENVCLLWGNNVGRDKGPFSADWVESPVPDDVRIWLCLRFLNCCTIL